MKIRQCLTLYIALLTCTVSSVAAQTYFEYYKPRDWQVFNNQRYVTAIATEVNYMYFTTWGGLSVYDELKENWQAFWLPRPIRRIAVGAFWLYLEIEPSTLQPGDLPYIWFEKSTHEWKYGNLPIENLRWFGGDYDNNKLALRYPFVHDISFMDEYLRNHQATAWLEDTRGQYLWVGTDGEGIFKYDTFSKWFEKVRFGLLDDQVNCMIRVDHTLWFGGAGEKSDEYRGLTIYDEIKNTFTYVEARHTRKFPTATVVDMVNGADDVWLATPEGLARFNKIRNGWQTFNTFNGLTGNDVRALALVENYIWVGLDTGLNWLKLNSKGEVATHGKVENSKLSYLTINDLAVHRKTIWAATRDGVYQYTLGDTAWLSMSAPAGQLRGEILSVCVDKDDEMVYFATPDGLVIYDLLYKEWDWWPFITKIPEVYNTRLPRIQEMAVDSSNLWLATDLGVWRYSKKQDAWHKYISQEQIGSIKSSYTVTPAGLPSNFVKDVFIDGNYVWFSTDRGATRFYWNDPQREW